MTTIPAVLGEIHPTSETTCLRCEETVVLLTNRAGKRYLVKEETEIRTRNRHQARCLPTALKPLQGHIPDRLPNGKPNRTPDATRLRGRASRV